jgi:hypothetical protein
VPPLLVATNLPSRHSRRRAPGSPAPRDDAEQRQRDHRPERVTDDVGPLEAERRDEGRQGVGELRRSPTVVDVRRLPETRRVPCDDGVVAGKVWEHPLPRAAVGRRTVQHDQDRPAYLHAGTQYVIRRRRRGPCRKFVPQECSHLAILACPGGAGAGMPLVRTPPSGFAVILRTQVQPSCRRCPFVDAGAAHSGSVDSSSGPRGQPICTRLRSLRRCRKAAPPSRPRTERRRQHPRGHQPAAPSSRRSPAGSG